MKIKTTIVLVILVLSFTPLHGQVEIPELNKYATDYTNTLDAGQLDRINRALSAFYDSTSNQIVFMMINTLDGYPLEMFSVETAQKNSIGTAKNDNGVLFLVVKDDKKMRLEVGYGLEGAIPDAMASSIIRNEVRPYFSRGDFYSGIAAGLNSVMAAAVGEYKQARRTARRDDDDGGGSGWYITMVVLFLLFRVFGGRGFFFLPFIFGGGGGSSRGGGGFGGGGFGGGGGFSGGGGSFGGGGASGGW